MYELPISVTVENKEYAIRKRGDFRMVLDCFSALNDLELDKEERIISSLIIFYQDFNSVEDIYACECLDILAKEMMKFFNLGSDDEDERKSSYRLIDWDKDSNLICSAVNKVAGKEIRAEQYIHWWTFMGYYMAIGQSPLSTIVGIRGKIARQEKLEKYEKRFRYENPQYFNMDYKSLEERELDAEMWKMLEGWDTSKAGD